jgi:hypothetical protein
MTLDEVYFHVALLDVLLVVYSLPEKPMMTEKDDVSHLSFDLAIFPQQYQEPLDEASQHLSSHFSPTPEQEELPTQKHQSLLSTSSSLLAHPIPLSFPPLKHLHSQLSG